MRKLVFILVATNLAILVAAMMAEAGLRVIGYDPWPRPPNNQALPSAFEYDKLLGWKNKPGTYVFQRYTEDSEDGSLTILPDGRRATVPPDQPSDWNSQVLLVGGSYVQGWAIADHETFAWKLQSRFPKARFVNYGTGGYGTYQSLLRMERYFAEQVPATSVVLYGFTESHENRNIAHAHWQIGLARLERLGHVYVPYCTITDSGKLKRHEPETCPRWPLLRCSATIATLHRSWWNLSIQDRVACRRRVTEELLLEMDKLCDSHRAELCVLLLKAQDEPKTHYNQFLRSNGIRVVDCTPDWGDTPRKFRVPNDGHPNGLINSAWARRLAEELGPL